MRSWLRFLREDLWRADLRTLPRARAAGWAALRILVHIVRSLARELGGVRAGALTLASLFALVPALALVAAVAKGLGYGGELDAFLTRTLADTPEAVRQRLVELQALVQRTDFQALGLLGCGVLIWSAYAVYERVESALDAILGAPRRRSLVSRARNFLAFGVVIPFLVVVAVAMSSFLQGASLAGLRDRWEWLDATYVHSLRLLPYLMLWLVFSLLYRTLPSHSVGAVAALAGGMVAGTAWLLTLGVYLRFQIGVAQANAIYATFAALPLLIVYLQVTWSIFLVGAEVARCVQSLDRPWPPPMPAANHALRRRMALALAHAVGARFAQGGGPLRLIQAAELLRAPLPWVHEVAKDLVAAGVLAQVAGAEAYVPMVPPEQLSVATVVGAVEGLVVPELAPHLRLPPPLESRLAQVEARTLDDLAALRLG